MPSGLRGTFALNAFVSDYFRTVIAASGPLRVESALPSQTYTSLDAATAADGSGVLHVRQVSVWVIIFTLDGLQESPLDVERDRSRFTLTDLDPVYASHWGNFGRSAGKE